MVGPKDRVAGAGAVADTFQRQRARQTRQCYCDWLPLLVAAAAVAASEDMDCHTQCLRLPGPQQIQSLI